MNCIDFDCIKLGCAGLDIGLNLNGLEIGLGQAWLPTWRRQRRPTGLHWVRSGQVGLAILHMVRFGWVGLDWVGLDWIGLDGFGLN